MKRSKSCGDKHRHASEGAALAHIRSLERRFPNAEKRVPYECQYGDHWHVGRKKKNKGLTNPSEIG